MNDYYLYSALGNGNAVWWHENKVHAVSSANNDQGSGSRADLNPYFIAHFPTLIH